jgi:hypothetical protein
MTENISKLACIWNNPESLFDPTTEVILVKHYDQVKEIIVIDGLRKIGLGSSGYTSLLDMTSQITREFTDKYGLGLEYVFINREGFIELTSEEDDSDLGRFIRSADYSRAPIRIIRVDNQPIYG